MLRFGHILRQNSRTATSTKKFNRDSWRVLKSWMSLAESGDQKAVLDLYAKEASLIPTLWNMPRETSVQRAEYFEMFVPRIVGEVTPGYIRETKIAEDTYLYFGILDFDLDIGKTGARKSFLIHKENNGDWKIMHHHSSQLPEVGKPYVL